MTSKYLSHLYFGTGMTDEDYANIPYPREELHFHVLNKGIQVGCVLGMGVIGPLAGLIRGRSLAGLRRGAARGGRIGCLIMIPFAPIMTELTIRKSNDEAIYDRTFRLRHNEGQKTTDRFAACGALAGSALGAFAGAGIVTGLMAGIMGGSFSAGYYNFQKRKEEKAKESAKSK